MYAYAYEFPSGQFRHPESCQVSEFLDGQQIFWSATDGEIDFEYVLLAGPPERGVTTQWNSPASF